jgi:Peptidase family M23
MRERAKGEAMTAPLHTMQRRLSPCDRRRGLAGFLAALLGPMLVASLGVSAGQAAGADLDPDFGSVLAFRVVAPPQPVLGADDRLHLVYELSLVNHSPFLVTLEAVQVLLPEADDAVVHALQGPQLTESLRINGGEQTGTTLGPSHSGYLFLDVTFAKDAVLPHALRHRLDVSLQARQAPLDDHHGVPLPPDSPFPSTLASIGARTRVVHDTAIVVAPPLKGPRWYVGNGCCAPPSAHRTAVIVTNNGTVHLAQRFAIDFLQLDDEGRLFTGDPTRLSSYPSYGAPVYAAADGIVARTHTGEPDNTPGELPPVVSLRNIGGNYVVVDMGEGRFAFYAHLRPDSITVQEGQRVHQGQVLGLLGNSGNSTAPHLHFHVMDGPEPVGSNGLPYVFRSFDGVGVVTNFDAVLEGMPALIDPSKLSGSYVTQLPLDTQLVNFP